MSNEFREYARSELAWYHLNWEYNKSERFIELIDEIIDTGVDSLFAVNQILAQIMTEEICEGKTDDPIDDPFGPVDAYGRWWLAQLSADQDFIDY